LTGIGGVQMVLADKPLEQMQQVVSRQADALIGYMTYPYLVNKYLMVDLVMAFVAKSDQGLSIGVNPEHPVLQAILNKAIATISGEEISSMMAIWTEATREETYKIGLTPEEQAWLAEHPEIVLGTTTEYQPMVIKRADGTYFGMLLDIYEQVNRRLNTKIRLHIEDPWAAVQEKAQNREIDGLAMGGRDPSRETLYIATDVIVPTYFSVFARSQNDYHLERFTDLTGMRIGYKRAARATRSLLEKLPSAILKPYDNHESMTQALLSKEIDVIVAWMSYDHWRKEKLQGTIDNILMIDEYPIEMVTHIRKDWPELIPILNKSIASLQQEELPRIINNWFGQYREQYKAASVYLTPEEKAWIAQNHKVRVRLADWPPYIIIKDNEAPQGISIEYLELIEKRTGIQFKYQVTDQTFAEFLESMKKSKGPDMTAMIVPTPEREPYLSFTEPYLSSPYVIFIREEAHPIIDIQGLVGKTLAVPRGFVVQQQLESNYPRIKLALFDTDEKALEAVATGQADAYIGNLTVASHIIHQKGLSHLKVTAATPFGDQVMAMGIRKAWPELTSVLNKALASITEEEKTAILNKYLAIKFQQGLDKAVVLQWIIIVATAASGVMLLLLFWNKQLSRKVKKHTADLAKSETKYRGLVENSVVGVFTTTLDGRFTFVNNAIVRMFDFDSTQRMIAHGSLKRWRDLKDRERMIAKLNKHGSVTNFEAETITHADRHIYVIISAKLMGDNIIGMVMDITDQKKGEEALQASREKAERLATKLISSQEAERSRLARELHDDITQRLAFLNIEVDKLAMENRSLSDPDIEKLELISQNIGDLSSDINMISRRLHPASLDVLGLVRSIASESNNFSRLREIPVSLDLDDTIQHLSREISLSIYRILQEGLRNIARHAKATQVRVALSKENHTLHLLIVDNGIGFDPALLSQHAGLGIASMTERARLIQGDLLIKSQPGKGTTIEVTVPLK
jgi:PAS domain S-box-containing protein